MSVLHQLEALKDLLQESVDRGTNMVEGIHRIVDKTVLETLQAENTEVARIYRERIAHVYESIRQINGKLGEAASEVIELVEEHGKVNTIVKDKEKLD